jgi:DNA-binding NtrC family response regulator
MLLSLGASEMARQPLVLLIPADRRTGAITRAGLESYGYDVLMASTVEEALDLLRANQRVSVLVVDVEPKPTSAGMALAKAARRSDPSLHVIYTCGAPYKLPEREKVSGAPCLRTPYHPHQLVGVIGQISSRHCFDEHEVRAA